MPKPHKSPESAWPFEVIPADKLPPLEDLDAATAPLAGGYWDSDDVPTAQPYAEPTSPNQALTDAICASLRLGAFFHVACQQQALSPALAREWIKVGQRKRSEIAYRIFAVSIVKAQAEARAAAEHRVYLAKPGSWLRQGPGRDRGELDAPGWTSSTNLKVEGQVNHAHLHGHVVANLKELPVDELLSLERLTSKALAPADK